MLQTFRFGVVFFLDPGTDSMCSFKEKKENVDLKNSAISFSQQSYKAGAILFFLFSEETDLYEAKELVRSHMTHTRGPTSARLSPWGLPAAWSALTFCSWI